MSKNQETKTTQTKHQDSLDIEKALLVKAIKRVKRFGVIRDGKNRKKNKIDSTAYRQRGNTFFKSKYHNSCIHAEILKLYAKSVALAPNNSEELSAAYGNRSALLFHLKKFEECINDCDLALSVCKSDMSKAKFLCRKVECLSILKDSAFEEIYQKSLSLIDQLDFSTSTKEKYIETLKNLKIVSTDKEANENQCVKVELPTFTHQKEAPCASEAITIKYNEEWGRHIVATRNVEPGEIVVVEKSYCSVVYPDELWFYCQNCVKFTWSSIPCEHCVYGIYCSKECRQEAWEKFHKFECEVYPYIWDIDEDLKSNTSTIRLILLAINEVGGISELRKEILDVENNQNPREKGFSKDGVFHSDKFRSIFSLNHVRDFLNPEDRSPLYAVAPLYYLATRTTLFGKKMPEDPGQLLLLDDALFFGTLMARLYNLVPYNFVGFNVSRNDSEMAALGFVATPFCSLFNHSCNPNTELVKSENNEVIAYVDRPVHEGEQLFIAYMHNRYDFVPKQERQSILLAHYKFDCNCIACLDDWTRETMPSIQDMLLQDPKAVLKIGKVASKFKYVVTGQLAKATSYEPELIKELAEMLKLYAEVLTPNSIDYSHYSEQMLRLFNKSFGTWFSIPDC